jgi:PAS domain S-box-containing protein
MKTDVRSLYNNLGVRSKLLLGYATVFVFSILVGTLLLYPIIRTAIESNIESNLDNTTRMILNTVETTADASIKNYLRAVTEKNRDIVQEFYGMYRKGLLSEEEAKRRAKAVLLSQRIGKTGYIYCINSKGLVMVHPLPEMEGVDVNGYAFVQRQLEKKSGYIEYEWKNPGEKAQRLKALSMAYFKPWDWIISATSYREEFRELVEVDVFRKGILSALFGKTGYAFIIDSRGTAIIHPHLESGNNFYDVKDADGKPFVREMCRLKNGRITYYWKNPDESRPREKIVIFNYIKEYDWIVASTGYVDEFYEPLRNMRNALIAVFIAALIGLLLLTAYFSSYFADNMDRLISGFRAGGSGDFSVRLPRLSGDEFGRLTEGFNSFMEKLEADNLALKQEIVRRRVAEYAMQTMNERYLSVLRAATGFAIIGTDTKGVIEVFNEGAELMLGYRADEVAERAMVEVIHDKAEIAARAAELGMEPGFDVLVRDATGGGAATREWTYIRKGGERLPAHLSVTSRKDSQGNVIGFLVVAVDITERRKAEEGLERLNAELEERVRERTVELETANAGLKEITRQLEDAYNDLKAAQSRILQQDKMASIGQLAAGIAHEINNPMGFIMSNLNTMRKYAEKLAGFIKAQSAALDKLAEAEGAAPAREELKGLERAIKLDYLLSDLDNLLNETLDGAERVKKIVQDLKGFARLDEAESKPADINQGIESAVNIIWNELKYKVTLKREYGDIPQIQCNPGQLNQVFLNIILNAAQAVETRGELTIRTWSEGGYVFIMIADTGRGIPADKLQRIFEPFYTTKEVGQGTGLGLSIAYDIIKKHNGEIRVESEVGKGTTFTVMLPAGPGPS